MITRSAVNGGTIEDTLRYHPGSGRWISLNRRPYGEESTKVPIDTAVRSDQACFFVVPGLSDTGEDVTQTIYHGGSRNRGPHSDGVLAPERLYQKIKADQEWLQAYKRARGHVRDSKEFRGSS